MEEKWAQLDVKDAVLQTLWTIVWPWGHVWDELKGLWSDSKETAGGLFGLRTDGLGSFLHDLWSNLLRLLDFPIALWRRINNIALALWGWITIARSPSSELSVARWPGP